MSRDEGQERRAARRWTSRSVGAPWQHRFFYLLIRLGGRRAAYLFLYFVAAYYVLFRPDQRRKCDFYLRRRFPGTGPWGQLVHAWRMILALGRVLIDRAVVGILGPGAADPALEGKQELLDLVAGGQGVILMGAHVGCWQTAMAALRLLDVPVSLLMQHEEGDVDRHFFEHSGGPFPFRIIDPRGYLGGTLEMLAVLKQGEILAVMGDRVQGSEHNTLTVRFLGATVRFPLAAYRLAAATGAPIGVLLSAKTGFETYRIRLAGVIRVAPGCGRRGQDFAPYAQRYACILEEYVRAYPYQFFNFFDLWEPETSAAAGPGPVADKE